MRARSEAAWAVTEANATGSFGGEDPRVLREPHDLERLLDRRRQPAEREPAAGVEHLLEDLDQDRDADRVHDLRLLEVEEEAVHAAAEERVGGLRDLLAAGVVDVAVGLEDRGRLVWPLHRDLQRLTHEASLRSVRSRSPVLPHDDLLAMRAALDPDVVH